jgi:hypothetical protein
MRRSAYTLVMTTAREALDKLASGVWVNLDDITPSGSFAVWHTVLKQRFRVVVVDYVHSETGATCDE